jgi:hypothetical protein
MRFPIERFTILIVLLLASLVVFSGCTSTRPVPNIPEAAPPMIMVDGESLPTLSFTKLIADVPGGRITGYHYEGLEYTRSYAHKWDENFSNQTNDLNFAAQVVLEDAGYRVKAGGLGELLMEGTIRKMSYNSYSYKVSFDQAECEMKWDVFRAGEDEPFFTTLTNGAGRVDSNQSGAIKAAFELALRRLLADEAFVEAVKGQK